MISPSTTITRRKGVEASRVRELVLPSDQTTPVYECDNCHTDISRQVRIRCLECDEFDLCTDCFGTHPNHKYTVCDALNYPLFPVCSPAPKDGSPEKDGELVIPAAEDAKSIWTVYEDLKLLRAIQTHGLGNWPDISEHVRTKTPKRCMERYLDDFLGRYGQVLPSLTLTEEVVADDEQHSTDAATTNNANTGSTSTDADRAMKRRMAAMLRSPGGSAANKRYKAVPTRSLPLSQWKTVSTDSTKIGTAVGRDTATRAEQVYVRTIATATDPEAVRLEWEQTRLNKPGGPTALPMRPDDVAKLPGVQVYGYMPRRGDFDIEWDNDAEEAIADMEFFRNEPENDKKLKLRVLQIYNHKLEEREKRKQFILSRRLYDYTARQQELEKLPRDERDLVLRMRLFERYHTVLEHQQFIAGLLKAKRLRKRIAKLQMYRRMGIQTLADAERYELDKARRNQSVASAEAEESSYFKQYKTSDRKIRKSVNRGAVPLMATASPPLATPTPTSSEQPNLVAPDINNIQKSDESRPLLMERLGDIEMKDDSEEESPKPNVGHAEKEAQEDVSPAVKEKLVDPQEEDRPEDLAILSVRERELCKSINVTPTLYLKVKRALIYESLTSSVSEQGSLVKIDIERKGAILEFVVRAGWVPSSFGKKEDSINVT